MSQPSFQSFADLFQSSEFIHRHVGLSQDEKEAMLKAVGADSMARDGALASLSVDFYKSGIQAGHMAAQILDGKIKPEETPVEDPEVYEVIINKKNAEILGIKIPDEYKNATLVD